jgi:hypothetical protein
MWGQSWGQMIWGAPTAVPAVEFWGVVLLAALLGSLGVRRLRSARPRLMGMTALAVALLVPITARAVPFTFTNGTVADATQVNANFAAVSGLAPAGSSNLVDLVSNGPCVGAVGAVQLGLRIGPDAIGNAFSVPAGQTLVLTTVNVSLTLGDGQAGRAIRVTIGRDNGLIAFSTIDVRTVTLDAHGAGSAEVSLGVGSGFGPGTLLCVLPQDAITGTNPTITASAHGFMTTQ